MIFLQRSIFALCATLAFVGPAGAAAPAAPPAPPPALSVASIGPGDQVRIEVFGNEDLSATVNVAENGSIQVPLVGLMNVGGQAPAEAARRIELALKEGLYLTNPQVTLSVVQVFVQRVTVQGEVAAPGRFPIESDTTIFDLMALAGGVTAKGSDVAYVYRLDEAGVEQRIPVDLSRRPGAQSGAAAKFRLKGGDSIDVPKATVFITGEVKNPGEFRLESGMLLYEAIARAGGVTPQGSMSRIEVQRRGPDNKVFEVKKVNKNLLIQSGDVIKVKERLF
jgi:polysaccharide biosynthesis/export protein